MSPARFFSDYFERNHLLVRAALPATLVTQSDVEFALHGCQGGDPSLRVHANGPVSPQDYTRLVEDVDGPALVIDRCKLRDLLQGGATLILDRADRRLPALGWLCASVASYTQQFTVANAYVAFGGAGAFGKHWDTHDVFVVHLAGRKLWRLYEPTHELPLPTQTSRDHKHECPEDCALEVTIEPGDVLYVPRGWWHEAKPLGIDFTMHAAFGIHTTKVEHYVDWVCRKTLPPIKPARETFRAHCDLSAQIGTVAGALSKALVDEDNLHAFATTLPAFRQDELGTFLPTAGS
jgi:ribosomal protein L16 Arg81 hydroxylase